MFTGHGSMLMAGMEGHADATCILAPAGLKVSPRGQGLLASKLHSDAALDRDTDHDDQRQVSCVLRTSRRLQLDWPVLATMLNGHLRQQ